MKAALFTGPAGSWPGNPMRVEEVPDPCPGPGEALVKVAACGVCRTDLEYLHEGTRPMKPFPIILGHEVSGTVAGLGEGVEGLAPGQRVVAAFTFPCGTCPWCRGGRENICPRAGILGASRDGGFAQYVAVPAQALFPLPPSLPLEESCVLTDAVATSYHALVDVAGARPGDVVAIYGASGGLGLAAVQLASALGCRVIAIGRQPWKLERARELGAELALSTEETGEIDREVNRLTGGGADISLDTSGVPALMTLACQATRPGGRIVIVGFTLKRMEVPTNRLVWLEHAILGSRTYRLQDLARVIRLAERGMVDPAKLVSHRFPLEGVNQAYGKLAEGQLFRGIVVPW